MLLKIEQRQQAGFNGFLKVDPENTPEAAWSARWEPNVFFVVPDAIERRSLGYCDISGNSVRPSQEIGRGAATLEIRAASSQ